MKKEANGSVVESVHSHHGSEKKSQKDEVMDTNHPGATVGMLGMMAAGASHVHGMFFSSNTPGNDEE